MSNLTLTQVYLEPDQKRALQDRAKVHGTKVAEEIRAAVDAYLSGVTPDELALLDVASKAAERDIQAMIEQIDQTNARLDRMFAVIEAIRSGGASA